MSAWNAKLFSSLPTIRANYPTYCLQLKGEFLVLAIQKEKYVFKWLKHIRWKNYISIHYDQESLDSKSMLYNFSPNLQLFLKRTIRQSNQAQTLVLSACSLLLGLGLLFREFSQIETCPLSGREDMHETQGTRRTRLMSTSVRSYQQLRAIAQGGETLEEGLLGWPGSSMEAKFRSCYPCLAGILMMQLTLN